MASVIYNNTKKIIGDGTVDWDAGGQTYRVLLTTSSYTPNIDSHIFVSSVTNELSGTGYSRKDLAGRTVAVDNANDRADYKADNVVWAALTAGGATAAKAVIFKLVTNDSDSLLIACVDFAATIMNGGEFTLKWDNQASNGRLFSIG